MQFFIIGFLALSVAGNEYEHAIKRSRRDPFDDWNLETSETTNSSPINTPETTVENTATTKATTDASTKVTTPTTTTTASTTTTSAKTEPATKAATTKSATTKAVETEATTTTTQSVASPTPAALVSNTTTVDEEQYYFGCGQGHWDDKEEMRLNNTCRFICNCGFEKDSNGEFTSVPLSCDPANGQCEDNSCPDGFEGEKCQTPICAVDCGAEGVCVHKHQCVCTNLYTRVTEQIMHDVHGDIIVHRCTNLRVDGLKGALCALVVLIVSISACACLHSISQKRMKAYSYVDDSHM